MKLSLHGFSDIVLNTGDEDASSAVEVFTWESFLADPTNQRRLPGANRKSKAAPVKPYMLPDNRLLRYVWKSTIGAGAFGRVQLVRSLDDGQCYAIKTIKKSRAVQHNQIAQTNNEAAILSSLGASERCPFIIELSEVFQDSINLYMVMDYVPGGDLYTLLKDAGKFLEPEARFYSCEILVAIKAMHALKIMHRDLKTANILIGRDGHLKVVDFGLATRSLYSDTLVGTPEYMAPEILLGGGYGRAVDYHAFGVLLYELHVGHTPYSIPGTDFPDGEAGLDAIADNIFAGPQFIKWPPADVVSPLARLLITSLMCVDPTRRLGNGPSGVDEIMTHLWFKQVDWTAIEEKEISPPYLRRLESDDDDTYFEWFSDEDARLFDPLRRGAYERDEYGKHFEDFPYVGASPADSLRGI